MRSIIHIDMDAFYAAVEERENPQLKDQPVIVGGTPEGRGVVATANYIARRYGVHSAMPAGHAIRLCPHAVFLPTRMALYASVSRDIRAIMERYTPQIEPLSLDEAFLDVTDSIRLLGSAESIAKQIKSDICNELQLVASAGVAPNKFLAKLAGDLDKPDGLVVVDPNNIKAFLAPLPIKRLWGVGQRTEQRLNDLGIQTIGDIQQRPDQLNENQFGALAEHIQNLAHGIDDRPVVVERQAKSISNETTFSTNLQTIENLRPVMLALTEQVTERLRQANLKARTINVKLRHGDFTTVTRAASLTEPVNSTQVVWDNAWQLTERYIGQRPFSLRLVGVGVSNLSDQDEGQMGLFNSTHSEVDTLSDEINSRFGRGTIRRGGAQSKQKQKQTPSD